MNANECRKARQEIDQSELGQRFSEPTESHVIACANCAAFRAERTSLRELVGSLQPVTAPADFDMRLRARIARERDASVSQPSVFSLFMSTPAIAVAALIVMVVGGIVWMNQRNGQTPTTIATNQPAAERPIAPAVATKETTPTNSQTETTIGTGKDSNSTTDGQKLASAPGRNSPKPPVVAGVGNRSAEFSVSPAPTYQMAPDRAGEVSLTAPVKPMVVTVYDEKGGSRKIMLPPVSFGAQRWADKATPVSATNTRDW